MFYNSHQLISNVADMQIFERNDKLGVPYNIVIVIRLHNVGNDHPMVLETSGTGVQMCEGVYDGNVHMGWRGV